MDQSCLKGLIPKQQYSSHDAKREIITFTFKSINHILHNKASDCSTQLLLSFNYACNYLSAVKKDEYEQDRGIVFESYTALIYKQIQMSGSKYCPVGYYIRLVHTL